MKRGEEEGNENVLVVLTVAVEFNDEFWRSGDETQKETNSHLKTQIPDFLSTDTMDTEFWWNRIIISWSESFAS